MKLLLWITYFGKDFCGFQVQPGKRTVQSTLQDAVQAVFGVRYSVTGCSRTDSGVHAHRFCCVVDCQVETLVLPLSRIAQALNAHLPSDLSVVCAQTVVDSFHPRYQEHEKEYHYLVWNAPYPNPLLQDRATFVKQPLDVCAMDRAAQAFVGTQDFASFCAAGSKITDTVRQVSLCHVAKEGNLITLSVRANGFLYHMVRILAGTLIEIGRGKYAAEKISEILAKKDRHFAGHTAPAHGLYLYWVYYSDIECPL